MKIPAIHGSEGRRLILQTAHLYKTVKCKKALKSDKKILKCDKGVDNVASLPVYSGYHRDWEKLY